MPDNQSFILSILVPVYNFDALPLALHLSAEVEATYLQDTVELIFCDDASTLSLPDLGIVKHARYIKHSENLGRSRIRNFLAEISKGKYLLYLDGDTLPVHNTFIASWLGKIQNDAFTVCTGTTRYTTHPPAESSLVLHWKYGHTRESRKASKISLPNQLNGFSMNNLCIDKSLYLSIKIDARILSYGHEDTVFGYQLLQLGHTIDAVENPVYHLGLNTHTSFVQKSLVAVENLHFITTDLHIAIPTRLGRVYSLLRKYHLSPLVLHLLYKMSGVFAHNLIGKRPSMCCLDLIKLLYFIVLNENHDKSDNIKTRIVAALVNK